jgi:hypothetical protein
MLRATNTGRKRQARPAFGRARRDRRVGGLIHHDMNCYIMRPAYNLIGQRAAKNTGTE